MPIADEMHVRHSNRGVRLPVWRVGQEKPPDFYHRTGALLLQKGFTQTRTLCDDSGHCSTPLTRSFDENFNLNLTTVEVFPSSAPLQTSPAHFCSRLQHQV